MRQTDPRARAARGGGDLREGLKQWRQAAKTPVEPPAPAVPAQAKAPSQSNTRQRATGKGLNAGTEPTAEATLSEEDRRLFRKTVGPVRPLPARQRNRRQAGGTPDDPVIREHQRQRRQRAQDTAQAASGTSLSDGYAAFPSSGDSRQYLAPSHGTDILRKLRQGHWPVEASLDLHGATQEQARERLDRYLQACLSHGLRCVRIVHGKGLGSTAREGPVLKPLVRRWLMQMPALIAYVECPPAEGGDGALRVLLRAQAQDGADHP